MISPAELAALQATANSALDQTIAVWRAAITQDGEGNVLKSWSLHATVAGNLAQPTASQLQNYGYAIADVAAWMVRVPVGTDIKIGDRLVVNGQNLEVQIELQPQSYQTAMRVLAAELEHV
jgi:head-tail adaptor